MTTVTQEFGYLEYPYLEYSYLSGNILASMGEQARFIIDKDSPAGQQAAFEIKDFENPLGQQAGFQIVGTGDDGFYGQQALFSFPDIPEELGHQAEIQIANAEAAMGQQAQFLVEGTSEGGLIGQQAVFTIPDARGFYGQQANFQIQGEGDDSFFGQQSDFVIGSSPAKGMEAFLTNWAHLQKGRYLERDYLVDAYLAADICAVGGMQADLVVTELTEFGQQANFQIVGTGDDGFYGQQANLRVADVEAAQGQQADFITLSSYGHQVNISLYSPTNLRILCEFPSRGLEGATGNNAWGNAAGEGNNWKASSTQAGDFEAYRLNTDIVEEVWRSASGVTTGVTLDCDTERPQGVFLDTFAILNHNLTSSATINLIGSNVSDFSVIGQVIPLQALGGDENIYYISPGLPTQGYRYWRIAIDDSSNTDGFISIGTILFGASRIFFGECFVDDVEFELRDYTDSVKTEAFTNVKNSRAQKKVLRLDFRSLDYTKGNFQLMRSLFRRSRTVLKCLWIPTPDPTDQEVTARFALFAKMTKVPVERHNNKGAQADYISFSLELDEAE